jgi:hypothetical protein
MPREEALGRRQDVRCPARLAARACTPPAPRKAAPKATAAPAPWCSAKPSAAAAAAGGQQPASASCPPSTARPCSPSKTWPPSPAPAPAPGAAGAGRVPRLPVRLLHAGLRDEPVRAVPEPPHLPRPRGRHRRSLSGNLCRCTGYRPIVDALPAAYRLPPGKRLDRGPILAALARMAALPPLIYRAGGRRFIAPRSLAELAAARQANPQARLVAGATDLALGITKALRDPGDLLWLGAVPELQAIGRSADGGLAIGAAASLADAFAALVAFEPGWAELARRFAGPPVRHAGTLGGNIANGSPIGDSMPGLIALGARLVLRQGRPAAPAAPRRVLPRLPADRPRPRRIHRGRRSCRPPRPAASFAAGKSRSATTRTSRPCAAPSPSAWPTAG